MADSSDSFMARIANALTSSARLVVRGAITAEPPTEEAGFLHDPGSDRGLQMFNKSVNFSDGDYGLNYSDFPLFDLPNMSHMTFSSRDFLPQELPNSVRTFFLISYTLIILLSVAGNFLVIVVVARNTKMRTVTNTFLVSLAVSDMLIAVVNMPFQLKFHLLNEWTLGEGLCRFSNYVQGAVVVTSILTLTGIAIDRYYAICHPLKARFVHTIRRAVVLITIFWVVSFGLVIPQLFIQRLEPVFKLTPDNPETFITIAYVCVEYVGNRSLEVAYTMFWYIVLYLFPVITMCVTYGKIAYKLWRRGPIGETPDNPHESERRLREKKKIVRMLMVIVLLFAISWFPFFTCIVYQLYHPTTHHDHTFRIIMAFCQLFGYSNSCVNPIVYCFLNESFQQHFLKTLCCKCFLQRLQKKRRPSTTFMDKMPPMTSSTNHSSVYNPASRHQSLRQQQSTV